MKAFYHCTILLFTAFVIFNSPIYAQRFNGASIAGISASQVDGDTQGGYKKPGFYAGVSVETNLTEIFGVKSELYYIGKGAKKKTEQFEEFNTSLHYVEMPFYLCIKPIKKTEMDLGLAGSYLIASKLKIYDATVEENLYDMHNFDFSAIISLIYYVGEKTGVNFKFNYSILPVKNNPNWFNNNISLGIIYKLGN
jgi:hypothetical protein